MHCHPPTPFSPLCVAIFDLRKADLMTSKDCMGLSDLSDVVKVQSKKPQRMLNKCAEIMKKHGFKEASVFLAGNFDLHTLQACLLDLVQWSLRSPIQSLRSILCIKKEVSREGGREGGRERAYVYTLTAFGRQ